MQRWAYSCKQILWGRVGLIRVSAASKYYGEGEEHSADAQWEMCK